jgi:hypothetical protein
VQAITLGVLAGGDLRLAELSEISKHMRAALPRECEWRMGTVLDERYAGSIHLVALLFDGPRQPGARLPDPAAEETLDAAGSLAGDLRAAARRPRGRTSGRLQGRGRFKDVEATLINGEDLDRPTYLRLGIVLDR